MKTFPILLKREFWEHRGGLMWAPLWTAVVVLVIAIIGVFAAELALQRGDVARHVSVGIDLGQVMKHIPDEKLAEMGRGYEIGLMGLASVIRLVMMIVVFFYCVGSLYDERKDRSVLFWKSLPVSDASTVMSKLVTAALVAPLLALAATMLLHMGFLALVATVAMFHGGDANRLVFGPAEPLSIWLRMLVGLPVNALWMLPSFGWLMLASSFARGKAFLWALVPPILLGVASNMSDLMQAFSLPSSWIWVHVVARVLPIGVLRIDGDDDVSNIGGIQFGRNGPQIEWSDITSMLANPETWIGVVAGVVMIGLAIHFRRTRELAD